MVSNFPTNPNGQATAANSQPVVLNSDVNSAAIKAASTAPVATDQAVVVTLSPNSPAPSIATGASTSALQTTGNTSVGSIDTKTPALGQALAASSVPVVLTAAQVTTLTPPAAITGFALDSSVNSLLKPASTLAAVTTVSAVTAITNALPTGANSIGQVTANAGTNLNTSLLALDATLTGGTAKAITRGGVKGTTTAADVTSSASGANHQPLDVLIYDTAGNPITSFGGGTQYTNGVATVANPIGTMPVFDNAGTISKVSNTVGLPVNIVAGSSSGQQYATGVVRGTSTGTLAMVDDGTNIRSAKGTTTGLLQVDLSLTAANATALKVDGSAVTQPISAASLPLPALAATSTIQTNGTQQTKITDGTNVATVKAASTAPVATDTALVVSISPNTTQAAIKAASTAPVATDTSVVVTLSPNSPAPALPTGGSTSALQTTGNTSLSTIATNTPALGQALATASSPVVLTAAQITTLTPPAAITGFALDTTLTGGTQKAIARGGVKGTTTAADITSTASGANHQPIDVAIYDASGTQITSFGGGTQYTTGTATVATPIGTMPIFDNAGTISKVSNTVGLPVNIVAGSSSGQQYATGAVRGTSTGTLMMVDDGTNIRSAVGTTAGVLKIDLSATTANATAIKVDGSAVTQPVSLSAGAAVIGKVSIDQTTPGTTNRVDIADSNNNAISAFPATFLRTSDEAHQLFYDAFDTALDTTNRWTSSTGSAGVAASTATGTMSLGTGTTANGYSKLTSQPTFTLPIPAWLGASDAIALPDGAAPTANSYRYWGTGTTPATPTVAAPITDGYGFELNTDGKLRAVVYAGGTRTVIADLSSSGTNTQPLDANYHRYIIYIRTDKAYWYIDGITSAQLVATSNFQSSQVQSLPRLFIAIGNAAPPATNTQILCTGATAWDTGKNSIQLSDGVFQWRKQTIKAASTAAASTDLPAVVALHPTSPLPAGTNVIGHVISDSTSTTTDTTATGTLTALNTTVVLNTNGVGTGIFELTGSWVGTVTFQGSNNNFTTSQNITAIFLGGLQTQGSTTTTNGYFSVVTAGFAKVRAIMTAYTSGTATVLANGSSVDRIVVPLQGNADNHLVKASGAATTAAPTYTTGTTNPLSLNVAGGLRVDGSGVTQPVSGTVTTTPPANASTNVAQLAGTATDTNSGVKSAGTLRVVLATDQPALTNKLLVTPDSVALPANQSVNVSQINAVTPLMGNGVSGTGSLRVNIASDNTAFAVTSTDAATSATGSAVPAKAIYKGLLAKTANPTASTDGNVVGAMSDKLGRQVMVIGNVRDNKANTFTTITSSTTETTIIAAVASTFNDLYGIIVENTSATGTKVTFKDSTAGTTQFEIYVPATQTSGFMLPSSDGYKQTTVNTAWTATVGTSVASITISALYVKNI